MKRFSLVRTAFREVRWRYSRGARPEKRDLLFRRDTLLCLASPFFGWRRLCNLMPTSARELLWPKGLFTRDSTHVLPVCLMNFTGITWKWEFMSQGLKTVRRKGLILVKSARAHQLAKLSQTKLSITHNNGFTQNTSRSCEYWSYKWLQARNLPQRGQSTWWYSLLNYDDAVTHQVCYLHSCS